MEGKKSKKRVVKKVKATVSKVFDCLFCNHAKTCQASIDLKAKVGKIACRICAAKWSTDKNISHLTAPIDIYNAWIDACEELNAPLGVIEGEGRTLSSEEAKVKHDQAAAQEEADLAAAGYVDDEEPAGELSADED